MSDFASTKQLPCNAAGYVKTVRIGQGSFSSVWRATCTSNMTDIAIKIMDLENISTSFEDILQEVQTMRLSEQENILNCYCSFVCKDQLWLVMQLMDKGSCLRVLSLSKLYGMGDGMSEECLAYILCEVVKGLCYIHGNGQIHRDIKSGNVLLNSAGNVKLADFGVSGWTIAKGERTQSVKTFVGTPCYMAPEVMEQSTDGYCVRADIWSLGIMALELAKGYAPYSAFPPMKVLILTIEEAPPSLRSSTYPHDRQLHPHGPPFSAAFEDFYKQCLQKSPKSRPSAPELSHHSFLRDRHPTALLESLLSRIPLVGTDEAVPSGVPEGTTSGSSSITPVANGSADLTVRTDVYGSIRPVESMRDRIEVTGNSGTFAPGTTWVFDDTEDEKAPTASSDQAASIGDFLEEFESDAATMKVPSKQCGIAPPLPQLTTGAFMDEFEGSLQDESS